MTRTNKRQGTRRGILRAIGASGVAGGLVGFAGCVTDVEDGGDGGNGDDGDGGDGGDGGNGGDGDIGTVRWGALEPRTGSYSDLGAEQLQGVELAVQQVNESDQFDFEIELEDYDPQSETTAAQRVASEAVEDFGAEYISGCISSSVALSISQFAQDNGVIYAPGAADDSITGSNCNEWVFRFETSTSQIAEAMAQWTVDEFGDRIFYHVADYDYGDSVLEEVERRMEGLSDSYEKVGETRSEFGSTEFESFISQIGDAADEADALVVGMTGGDLVVFLQQAARQGLMDEIPVVTTTASFTPIRGPIGEAGYGVYSGVRYVPHVDTGDNAAFVETYQEEYDATPDNFARVGYESVRMIAHGIQEAGTSDPGEVKDVLPGLEMETIFGTNQFRECDHQAMNPVWMGELVEPDEGDVADVELLTELSGEEAIPDCEATGCEL